MIQRRFGGVAAAGHSREWCDMNLIQFFMTGFLTVVGYFLLMAFTGFEHRSLDVQVLNLVAIVVASFVLVRKVFAS